MSTLRQTWKLKEIPAYTAECPHCGVDLLEDDDYCCWIQPEGVEVSIEESYLDFCPDCKQPITERGWDELEEDEATSEAPENAG